MKLQETGDPFCLGSHLLKTSMVDQFGEAVTEHVPTQHNFAIENIPQWSWKYSVSLHITLFNSDICLLHQ